MKTVKIDRLKVACILNELLKVRDKNLTRVHSVAVIDTESSNSDQVYSFSHKYPQGSYKSISSPSAMD